MNAAVRGLCLAWGAVVALLAYPAGAQFLGDQRAILGGEWFYRPLGVAAAVTIAAPAYTRTVTASSYTLTGTSTGSGAVSWAASPSGSSGACTGTDTFSCVVTVTPDAVGEGVEVITVTRGTATDTETLGFYVAGAHTTFLSQNVNGTYNAGVADLDAVSTWENVGTSALDVTQGTGTAQPTFRTSIVGGQPVVRCDGGDFVGASTASDWTFLHNGTDTSVGGVIFSGTQPAANRTFMGNAISAATHGASWTFFSTQLYTSVNNATPTANYNFPLNGFAAAVFNSFETIRDDDGGAGVDVTAWLNNSTSSTTTRASTYSATAAGTLALCSATGGGAPATVDLFRVLIYQSALDSTQRGINKAVDEWALGGTLPVTP